MFDLNYTWQQYTREVISSLNQALHRDYVKHSIFQPFFFIIRSICSVVENSMFNYRLYDKRNHA